MKEFILKIKARRWLQILLAVLLVSVVSMGFWQVSGAAGGKEKKRVVTMELGGEYDVSIGRAGIFFGNSQMEGTLVVSRQDHKPNSGSGIIWQQQMLTVKAYEGDEGENQYGSPRGLGYVYFNMDILERRDWDDYGGERMSIWYFHDYLNRWVECPTTLRRDVSAPRGRLSCYLEEFGQYGLGIQKETLVVKMTKRAIIQLTTSLTPTVTITPSPTP